MTRPSHFSGRCRLIVTDIDCTFLATDKTLIEENCRAVAEAQRAGIQLSFGTGRFWKSLRDVMEGHKLMGPQILDNGATIADASDGWRVLSSETIPAEAVQLVWELGNARGFTPVLCTPEEYYCWRPDAVSMHEMLIHKEPCIECETQEILLSHKHEIDKVAFYAGCPYEELVAFANELSERIREKALPVYVGFTEKNIIVVAGRGINKMRGIRKVCDLLGCTPDDAVAIGDADNDVEMLAGCGLGFAMGNANQAAKDVATHIVGTNDEAGFAQAVRMVLAMR